MTDPLAAMRTKFLARCAEDLSVLIRQDDEEQVLIIAHRLAGSAGIFGYAALGSLALSVDDYGRATGRIDDAGVQALIDALRRLGDADI